MVILDLKGENIELYARKNIMMEANAKIDINAKILI